MPKETKTTPPRPESETKPSSPTLEELAEQYLDFWQQNLTVWATDPKALEKWVETLSASQSKRPSDKD
ncbi:hypothetical protein [Emcibacter nanhaiensis]|uniref:Uncharacterized protein n=1 Tax=Emcibacter nanhaiensis TaxID=1505037 RepID=A0A501PNJ4_9PROT|nr:hypothetical protein [Emcibacter nanhaiensis]TPD61677.1 hypothetical protein FIV46_05555 [Emcibacter nanhaiensis]